MYKYALIALLAFIVTGCKKSETGFGGHSPSDNEIKATITIDGDPPINFVKTGANAEAVKLVFDDGDVQIAIGTDLNGTKLTIGLYNILHTGTYSFDPVLATVEQYANCAYVPAGTDPVIYGTSNLAFGGSGTVTITEINSNYITGTFNAIAPGRDGRSATISSGSFKCTMRTA